MRNLIAIFCVLVAASLASCDLRSGTAKKEVEKYETTPAQEPVALPPAAPPIDPADIVEVDTTLQGKAVSLNIYDQKKAAACTEFNQLMINGSRNVVTVKGVCRQILINGDDNQITIDAAMEFVFNGSENVLKYSRFPNGKRPSVIQNQQGNIIEKMAFEKKIK